MLDEPETRTIRRLRSLLMQVMERTRDYWDTDGNTRCIFCRALMYHHHAPDCLRQQAKQLLYETRIPRGEGNR